MRANEQKFNSIDEALPVLRKLAQEGYNFYFWGGPFSRGPEKTGQEDWEIEIERMREYEKEGYKPLIILKKTTFRDGEEGYIFGWRLDFENGGSLRNVLFIRRTERPAWNKITP